MKPKGLKRNGKGKGRPLRATPSIKLSRLSPGAIPESNLKIKQIVVPIDFSPESKRALRFASKLAAIFGSTIQLVHVVEPASFVNDLPNVIVMRSDEEVGKEAAAKLQSLTFVQRSIALKPFHSIVRFGQPVEEIIRTADDIGAAAIVISTHGLTGIRRALIGSTVEQVIRHARRPVRVVPARKMYD